MKTNKTGSKIARRYFRNAVKVIFHAAPLKRLLFARINRHEAIAILKNEVKGLDFSDARYYEQFTRHSSHYSPKNYI